MGSEMCIRDRGSREAGDWHLAHREVRRDAGNHCPSMRPGSEVFDRPVDSCEEHQPRTGPLSSRTTGRLPGTRPTPQAREENSSAHPSVRARPTRSRTWRPSSPCTSSQNPARCCSRPSPSRASATRTGPYDASFVTIRVDDGRDVSPTLRTSTGHVGQALRRLVPVDGADVDGPS